MFTSLSMDGLVDCLSQVPPIELEAVRLLHALPAMGGWFPTVPPDCLVAATQELITYTKDCAALLDKLTYLPPIILSTVEIPEWPL